MKFRSRAVRAAAVAVASFVLAVFAGGVLASGATSQVVINSAGGTAANGSDGLRLTWGSNSQFQARIANLDQVYNTGATPMSGSLFNSVYLRVDRGTGAVRVYNNSNNANASPFLTFTQVSQSAQSGAGTAASPWQVTTVLRPSNAADTGITVTILDSYIRPQAWFTRRVTLTGLPASGADVRFYQNIDTYLQGGDNGPGFTRTSPSNTSGVPDFVGVTKGAQIEALWHEASSGTPIWNHYFTGNYSWPQNLICNGTNNATSSCTSVSADANAGNLSNLVDANAATDNGMAAQWNVPAGASTFTAEYRVTFAPNAVDLTKQFSPAAIAPNGVSTLTFVLTNRTTGSVAGINFLDTLPSGVVVAPTPNIRTSCPSGATLGTTLPSGMSVTAAAGGGTIQVTGASINGAASSSTTLNCQVAVDVTGSAFGTYHNTSSNITSTNNLVNLVGDETLTITQPQLTAGKTVVGTLTAGQTGAAGDAYYRIGIQNSGGLPTHASITIDEILPSGVTVVAASSSDGTVSCPGLPASGTLTCTFTPTAALAAGASAAVRLNVAIPASASGSLTNRVGVAGGGDPDPLPNCASSTSEQCATNTSTVAVQADLSVLKTGPAGVLAGNTVSYTIAVGNAGPSNAQGVSLDDPTPSGLTFVSASAPCSGGFPCSLGAIAAGASTSITVVYAVPPGHLGAQIVNTASVAATTADPDTSNNSSTATTGVSTSADLSVVKTGPASATPGQSVTYALAVSNAGPSTALGVMLSDLTPAGLSFVSASAPCAGGFPCAIGALAPGASISVNVTFAIPASHSGAIVNTATVSAATVDPDPGSNSSSVTTPIAASADLRLVKTGPASATPGQNVSYTLALTNNGPSNAQAVTLNDPTPAGLTFVSATAPCAGGFPCTIGTLAAGANTTVTVTFAVPADHSGAIVNTATASSSTTDPDPGSNSSTVTTPVSASADLRLVKTGPASATPGQNVSYTLSLTNDGPSDAQGVSLNDPTPSGLTFLSASAPCASGFPCTIGTLASGASSTVTVTFAVPADHSGAIVNTATASSTTTDPDPGSNSSTVTTPVSASADLRLVKTGPAAATSGENVSYTLSVSNDGPSNAAGVVLDDPTPAGLTFVSATAPCASGFPCALGTLAPGASTTVTVTFAIPANHSGAIVNTATVSSSTADPDPGSNSSTVTTPALASADIAIAKIVDVDTPNVGEPVVFTITAANLGPSDATGIVVTDAMPAGLSFVSANAAQGSYDAATGAWTVGALTSGSETTLTIIATVTAPGEIVNTATRTAADQTDPNPANNSAVAAINGQPSADVQINKTVSNATPNLGTPVTFTITAHNAGPNDASGVVVTDLLPAGLGFQSAMPSQGNYDPSNGYWTIGTIVAGSTQTLTITALVQTTGAVTNLAIKTAQVEHDPNPANDQSGVVVNGQAADIQVVKVVDEAAPTVGDTVTFTVTVSNNGPSAATGVVVNDLLPGGLSFVGAAASQGAYVPTTGEWTIGALGIAGPSATATLTVSATVAQDGTWVNTATRTASDQTDTNAGNDSASATVVASPNANLSIVKTGPASATAGQNVIYTLAVTNAGPSAAQDVAIDDPTPAGLTFVSASAPCASGFPCTIGTLAAGATTTVTATFAVPAGHGGSIVNTATVSSSTLDPVPGDDSSTVTTPVTTSADLRLVKTGPAAATPGQNVTYTLAVTNDGPSDAQAVALNDPTPAGLTFVSASAPCAGGFPCAIGTLAAGASTTVTVTFAVPAGHSGSIVNSATVSSSTTDPDPGSNSSSVTTPVVASADLRVIKTGPASATPGQTVAYTLSVTNDGPSDAQGVSLNDPTPAGLTFVSAAAPCASGFPCALGTLAAGASTTVTVTFAVPASHSGAIVNTATVSASTADPDPGSNSASVTTPVNASADLRLVKTGPAAATAGENVSYTLTLSNDGPSDAQGVSLDDPAPAGLTFVSASAPCAGGFPCAIGTLASGASTAVTVTFAVSAGQSGSIANTATAGSATADPNPANNSSTATTPVSASADLHLVKTGPASTTAGEDVSYTLTLSNDGPSDAQGVSLDDPTPSGLTFVSASAPCAGGFPCAIGTLASGASSMVTVTFAVPADHSGAIANTATASSTTTDPDPSNNSSTATTPVGSSADLTVVKTGPASATPGENVSYTLSVSNDGPSNAAGVILDDPTPAGLTFVSATAPCASGFPCALGTLAPGADTTVTVTFAVPAGHAGAIVNTATVSSSTADPDPGSNSSTVTTPALASADIAIAKIVDVDTPNVGEPVVFTITASNLGPSDATGIVVTDAMPAGLSFVSANAAQGSYDAATGAWTVGALTSGSDTTLTITATVTAPGEIVNTATRTAADQTDPNPANNSAVAAINGQPSADVQINKTVDDATPNLGAAVTFTITAHNAGPNDASGVVVTDLLPAGLGLQTATASQGSYDAATGLWQVGPIASGTTQTLTIIALVQTTDAVTNLAIKTAQVEHDPNPANDQSGVVVNGQAADIQVVKVVDEAAPTVGDTVTFTVTVSNNGPSAATGVVVTDLLPTGLGFVDAVASQGSYDPATGEWIVGALDIAGATATATLTVRATAAQDGKWVNTATRTASDQTDTNAGNDSASATVVAGPSADVSVDKTGPVSATAGKPISYTLTVANAGPSVAQGIMLDDPTPAGLTFVSASAPCASGFPCAIGALAAGGEVTVTVNFAVGAAFTGTQIVNVASVTATTFDPNPANDRDTVNTPVGAAADLFVIKHGPAAATPGQPLVYTIDVANAGPSEALDVVLSDATPPGLVFVSASAPCQAGFPCALGTMAADGTRSIEAVFAVPADYQGPDPILNTASVASATADPNVGDNASTATTPIGASADLSIVKTGPASASVGQTLLYTLTIGNAGPSAAQGIVVDDPTPAGLSFVSASAPCEGGFPCALGTLGAGGSAAIEVRFAVPADYVGDRVVNTATVAAATPDPNPADNTGSATTTIGRLSADLSLVKTGPATVTAGQLIAYVLVIRNSGPDAASEVVLDDQTPQGLSFVTASAPCASGFPCALGTLAANASVTVTAQFRVPADHAGGPIVNTASVVAQTADPTPANNASSATTVVNAAPAAEPVAVPVDAYWMRLLTALLLTMAAAVQITRRR
jgi:uncharacterized repeat protein (TIGR01451 family)